MAPPHPPDYFALRADVGGRDKPGHDAKGLQRRAAHPRTSGGVASAAS
jgi:hypothetical protein